LTVTAAALNGKPDNGDSVLVFNADNCGTSEAPPPSENAFYYGVARFSVPDGHYRAIGQFINFSPKGLALRMPILPQFTVGANTAVHMSERAASSEVSVATAGDHAERLSGGGAHYPAVAAFHRLDCSWLVALG